MLEGRLALWQDAFFDEVYIGARVPEADGEDE
jgi:segregation and condensation protein A